MLVQTAYWKHVSTDMVVLHIQHSHDQAEQSACCFVCTTFDMFNHDILLDQLEQFNFQKLIIRLSDRV